MMERPAFAYISFAQSEKSVKTPLGEIEFEILTRVFFSPRLWQIHYGQLFISTSVLSGVCKETWKITAAKKSDNNGDWMESSVKTNTALKVFLIQGV